MVAISYLDARRPLHPLHAILLSIPLPLFIGALICDVAYSRTWHVQWGNFSSWLIAGALVGCGLALLWALVALIRNRGMGDRGRLPYFLVLLGLFVVGLINAFVHAKDAAATMPEGLWLSAACVALALVASWIGFAGFRTGDFE